MVRRSIEQLKRELEVIEMIDTIYPREKDRTTLDVNAYEARQRRKQDLLRMIDEGRMSSRLPALLGTPFLSALFLFFITVHVSAPPHRA
jgi:hypothetical protein